MTSASNRTENDGNQHPAIAFDRWKRLAACVLLGTCIALLCTTCREESRDLQHLPGRARTESLLQVKGSFSSWYRQQSADSWFGKPIFDSDNTKGQLREHKQWMSKEDLATLPIAEKQRAERRLKSRMVQLALQTMMVKDKSQKLEAALGQRLAEIYSPGTQQNEENLAEPAVQAIVHRLVLQFMNRTMMGAAESEADLRQPTVEEKQKAKKEQEQKDAAEKALDEEIEKVSPTLQEQYEHEAQEHQEQNKRMDAVSKLLAAMTNSTGYGSADISQCRDHCAEVIEKDALARAELAEDHKAAEAREESELLHGLA